VKVGRLIGDTAARLPLIGGAIGRLQIWLRKPRAIPPQVVAPLPRIASTDYLPSQAPAWQPPEALQVAVIIPVYRGLEETCRCLGSVLSARGDMAAEIIVIDDFSPEPELSRHLDALAVTGAITLLRNEVNRGFVASVNRGMSAAGGRDVILLNSDTEVPAGWIRRLAGHAYSDARIGSVTPFSNNATICSWPSVAGGALPHGKTVDEMDAAFLAANRGRQVDLPTAVGFCMYIRRDCLDQVGGFDEATFGRGYGEENDFCLRASAAGWRHLLACDTFVFHIGETSFGKNSPERARAWDLLVARYPDYPATVARHIEADPAACVRFAATAALFRLSAEPTILVVTHALGGGTERHVRDVQAAVGHRANFLRLEPRPSGLALSVPSVASHPELVFASDQLEQLIALIESCGLDRVHVHHWLGHDASLRRLLDRLARPFDVTIHDYFSICPKINLLPTPTSRYCEEPDAVTCNACIAGQPQFGATDITDWRTRYAWLLQEAERAICPSIDTRDRMVRYAPHARLMVVPHEPVTQTAWEVNAERPVAGEPLRIGIIGAIGSHKGFASLAAALDAADPREFVFIVIGYCGPELPRHLRHRMHITGPYVEADLPSLIAKAQLHVTWFPATWPETYNYTLSAALAASLPVVASSLGAFPERLQGRPLTWTVNPSRGWDELQPIFNDVRAALLSQHDAATAPRQSAPEAFYPDAYLEPLAGRRRGRKSEPTTLRKPGVVSVIVVPDRHSNGVITPCGHIRLVQPLDAMSAAHTGTLTEVLDLGAALCRDADVLVCQRHVAPDLASAEQLIAHCKAHDIRLVYDLDDDLLSIPLTHPEFAHLDGLSAGVRRLVLAADTVWVSTPSLQRRLASLRPDVTVIANMHDQRIWRGRPSLIHVNNGPVRILYMGTATHDADLAFLRPVAEALLARYGQRVCFEVIGITSEELPSCFRRVAPENGPNSECYPGFVEWFTRQSWDIAVSPLVDDLFNQSKSAIKLWDYAALSLPVVASRNEEYLATFGDGHGVKLVENTLAAWVAELSRLIDDSDLRRQNAALISDQYRRTHQPGRQADLMREHIYRAASKPRNRP